MGNSIGGKKAAKIMKIDGTTFKVKPPAQAMKVLLDHPGYNLLDAEEVKLCGLRTKPLDPDALFKPGKLYFLVELPRLPDQRVQRRAWSGQLPMGAKERLETLRLTRRSLSDLSVTSKDTVEAEKTKDGTVRLRMRLPKAQVAKLMKESKDSAEAAEKIMELCAGKGSALATPSSLETITPAVKTGRKEKRTRFVALPDEIIA